MKNFPGGKELSVAQAGLPKTRRLAKENMGMSE